MDWIHLAQIRDRWRVLMITEMNLGSSIKGVECFDHLGFSRRTRLHEVSLVGRFHGLKRKLCEATKQSDHGFERREDEKIG
jgi:hypothetical protein